MVQLLATGAKRKVDDIVTGCPIDMNGVRTIINLRIKPLGSYNFLIGMRWLDVHHAILDFHNKT